MFIDNVVRKDFEGEERFDKFAIASTIVGVSFQGASCSLIESEVINSCDSCNLRYLCRGIDEVVEDYIEKTTTVSSSFSFNNKVG